MNSLHFFFGLGALGAPLILAQVLSLTGGNLGTFWPFAPLSLPIAVWLWRLPPPANLQLPGLKHKNGAAEFAAPF